MAKSKKPANFDGLVEQIVAIIKDEVSGKLVQELIEREKIVDSLVKRIKEMHFEPRIVPASAVDFDKARLSGNCVSGGTIRQFSSTGIEDIANSTQLTVLDDVVVVEGRLAANSLAVTGDVEVKGNVTIHGDMPLDQAVTAKLVEKISKTVNAQVTHQLDEAVNNINGDNIIGGVIREFRSTGIDDFAEGTQLTVMDDMVVVEDTIVTRELNVKGDTVIEGNLTILGDTPLDEKTTQNIIEAASGEVYDLVQAEFKDEIISSVADKINGSVLDVGNLSIGGRELFENENTLAPFVRNTSITKVGHLKELIVSGEASIFNSLYVGNKRVGVNTTHPAAALTIWDEEIELVSGKHSKNIGFVGTLRPQEVILGSNNKSNVVLATNGLTAIKNLMAADTRIYSSDKTPDFESTPGAVCFNTHPKTGEAWGWMCLGGARWGVMGKIV